MSDDSGSAVLVFTLGFLLVLLLVFANLTLAVDRTALDSDHTVETMEDEGVFSQITTEVQSEVTDEINENKDEIPAELEEELGEEELLTDEDVEEISQEALSESYVQGELTRNIENIYAVLEGETDEVNLYIDLAEPKTTAVEAVEEREREIIRESGYDEEDFEEEVDGLVSERLEEEIPDQQNLTEDGDAPEEAEAAEAGIGIIGTLAIALPVGALALIGGIYFFSGKSLHRTGNAAGFAFIVASVIGLGIGYGLGGFVADAAESAVDVDSDAVEALADGAIALVESSFSAIVTQSLVIGFLGVASIGAVYADKNGYFDELLSDDDTGEQGHSSQQQGQQQHQQGQGEQYQQSNEQYQQEQYQQGQHGQYQGQYDQNQQYQQSNEQYQQGQYDQNQQYQQGNEQYQQGQYDQNQQYQQGNEQYQGQYNQNQQYQQGQGEQYQHEQGDQYDEQADEQAQDDEQPQNGEKVDEQAHDGQTGEKEHDEQQDSEPREETVADEATPEESETNDDAEVDNEPADDENNQ